MKQTLVVVIAMAYCTCRSFVDPFWALFMYYGLAVLRPQVIWQWALPSQIRWSFYAALLAIVTAVLNIRSMKPTVVRHGFVCLLMLLALCLFVSVIEAHDQDVAKHYGWEYAKIFVMLIVGTVVVNQRRHVRYLGWMIFAFLLYLTYEVNWMYLFDHRLDILHRGYGGLDNNGAALVFAMHIPFCYFFFLAEKRWWRWGFLAAAGTTVHAVMLTYSRGAMLSSIIVAVMMLLTTMRKRFAQTLVVGLFTVTVVFVMAGPQIRHRFQTTFRVENDGSAQSRLGSWEAGWNIAKDHPFSGIGLRNSNLFTKDYGADISGRTIHNLYIQVAADSGIPAALFLIGLVVLSLWWLHCGAKRSAERLDEDDYRWHHYICRASFWSLVTFAFGSVFLSTENVELCYLLMLIAAVAPTLARSEDADEESCVLGEHGEGSLPAAMPEGGLT